MKNGEKKEREEKRKKETAINVCWMPSCRALDTHYSLLLANGCLCSSLIKQRRLTKDSLFGNEKNEKIIVGMSEQRDSSEVNPHLVDR